MNVLYRKLFVWLLPTYIFLCSLTFYQSSDSVATALTRAGMHDRAGTYALTYIYMYICVSSLNKMHAKFD
jgi:hypothetical protein